MNSFMDWFEVPALPTHNSDGGVVRNLKESIEIPIAEMIADMDIEVIPGEGIQDISDLNGEQRFTSLA